jgi:hypothetical protein
LTTTGLNLTISFLKQLPHNVTSKNQHRSARCHYTTPKKDFVRNIP